MVFNWSILFGTFSIAVIFVVIKAFFEKEQGEQKFSKYMVVEILILTALFQVSNWIFS